MRSKQPLIALLQGLTDLLEEEAARNPDFAARLYALMKPEAQAAEPRTAKALPKRKGADLPDIHGELAQRGDEGFRAWLSTLGVDVLKAVIRREDLDATRRAAKWKDERKLADFIADGLRARMSRGSAFIGRAQPASVVVKTEPGEG